MEKLTGFYFANIDCLILTPGVNFKIDNVESSCYCILYYREYARGCIFTLKCTEYLDIRAVYTGALI